VVSESPLPTGVETMARARAAVLAAQAAPTPEAAWTAAVGVLLAGVDVRGIALAGFDIRPLLAAADAGAHLATLVARGEVLLIGGEDPAVLPAGGDAP